MAAANELSDLIAQRNELERQISERQQAEGNADALRDGLTREELLTAAEIMAGMISDEWPGPLTYSVETWGSATSEQMEAFRKLEAYLDASRNAST